MNLEKLNSLVEVQKEANDAVVREMQRCFPCGAAVMVMLSQGQVNASPAHIGDSIFAYMTSGRINVLLDKVNKRGRRPYKYVHYTNIKLRVEG